MIASLPEKGTDAAGDGDAKPKSEPISEELEAARADWQSEKTIANAARYITLLELSIRIK